MRRILVALAFLAATPVFAAQQDNPALHRLFAEEWERGLRDSPENASYQGDARFNDRWSDLSLKAIAARSGRPRRPRPLAQDQPQIPVGH
ncbi:DUF885 domain-containing protein [Massilia sp. B-10]|nr:DUF885 domain-containing protein [Massilia sp. B-10]